MPSVSRFYGLVIYIYFNDHAPPHFHAVYGEYQAEVEIASGRVLKGKLPPQALSLVRQWARVHRGELTVDWGLAQHEQRLNPIPPLE